MRTVELSTHIKCFSRSKGHSAVAAAAYRAGVRLTCERTGITHDYRRRSAAVLVSGLIFPDGTKPICRRSLWNAVEHHEKRKNSRVAREWMFALPADLSGLGRRYVVEAMARYLVGRHGVAVDYAIHAPPRDGDDRNHHVHMLMTTRRIQGGQFTEKCRELDRKDSGTIVKEWRAQVAALENMELEREARAVQIEHRSFASRGIQKTPVQHRGKKSVCASRVSETEKPRVSLKKIFTAIVGRVEGALLGLCQTRALPAHFLRAARYVFVNKTPRDEFGDYASNSIRTRSPPAQHHGLKLRP